MWANQGISTLNVDGYSSPHFWDCCRIDVNGSVAGILEKLEISDKLNTHVRSCIVKCTAIADWLKLNFIVTLNGLSHRE